MEKTLTPENLEKTLDGIRPYLREDGGDVELVNITEDNIVNVRLLGACNTCPLSLMTLRAGIERVLMNEYPAIVRVENVM
ncbi:MAG: NifU family protein [Ignavibacteria bacterium]|jgi:Fe-S cluster biogenesis protein NfuA|nr:NifU family protein [Ignavibacteria bacterium]